jgi:hypothetical protein
MCVQRSSTKLTIARRNTRVAMRHSGRDGDGVARAELDNGPPCSSPRDSAGAFAGAGAGCRLDAARRLGDPICGARAVFDRLASACEECGRVPRH